MEGVKLDLMFWRFQREIEVLKNRLFLSLWMSVILFYQILFKCQVKKDLSNLIFSF